jgi:hypothetical protein
LSESTRAIILIILVMLLLLAVAFAGSNYMMRRAIKHIIRMLKSADALSLQTARTSEELGFKKTSMFQFKLWRDYKPAALQLLLTGNIVLMTDDGKLYLSEENLSKSKLAQQIR